jgi:hypothetical protein
MPCVRGPALARPASPGGKATQDTSAAPTIAVLRRGGRRPPAAVDPAERRATRALRRRRRSRTRTRAALLPPVPHPPTPDHLAESGNTLASQANRDGGAERCPEPAGQQRRDVARALLGSADERRRARA